MKQPWSTLTGMTRNEAITVSKVTLDGSGVTIEGAFELPPLAGLSYEDQIFAAAFIRTHGSIKQMEVLFGVSYPTIKNRLNRISGQLRLVDVQITAKKSDILGLLEKGEISAEEAIERMRE
ncbi:DUF2089 domain-containing protein [bacterium]|nr:DUF2089 domain-containing protein [bacterium]